MHLAKQLKVHDLPDIKIFRNGIPTDYQAAASTIDIVDVARWNAGNALTRRHNAVSEVNGPAELEVLLHRHATHACTHTCMGTHTWMHTHT